MDEKPKLEIEVDPPMSELEILRQAHDAQNSALNRKQLRIYEYRKLIKRLCGLLRFKRMEFDALHAENAARIKWLDDLFVEPH